MDIKDKDEMKIPLSIAQDFISECMKKRRDIPRLANSPREKARAEPGAGQASAKSEPAPAIATSAPRQCGPFIRTGKEAG